MKNILNLISHLLILFNAVVLLPFIVLRGEILNYNSYYDFCYDYGWTLTLINLTIACIVLPRLSLYIGRQENK